MPWQGDLDADAELLVDGMLGSGLERDVGGEFAACVQALNAHPAPHWHSTSRPVSMAIAVD